MNMVQEIRYKLRLTQKTTMMKALYAQYLQQKFVDVNLICIGAKIIRAHKNVLAAASELFLNIFEENASNTRQLSLIFNETISEESLRDVLTLVYCGEIELNNASRFQQLIKTATFLKVDGVHMDSSLLILEAADMSIPGGYNQVETNQESISSNYIEIFTETPTSQKKEVSRVQSVEKPLAVQEYDFTLTAPAEQEEKKEKDGRSDQQEEEKLLESCTRQTVEEEDHLFDDIIPWDPDLVLNSSPYTLESNIYSELEGSNISTVESTVTISEVLPKVVVQTVPTVQHLQSTSSSLLDTYIQTETKHMSRLQNDLDIKPKSAKRLKKSSPKTKSINDQTVHQPDIGVEQTSSDFRRSKRRRRRNVRLLN